MPLSVRFSLLARSVPVRIPKARTIMAEANANANARPRIKGVVFDMDGTLTVPVLDFALMRRKVLAEGPPEFAAKCTDTAPFDILHNIEQWEPERQQRAYSVITCMEREAQQKLQIMPGALELCKMLDSKQIRRGLITRNFSESVDLFHSRFGMKEFSPALSREFRPYKPDPAPLLHICATWEVMPKEVMMVGDCLSDDEKDFYVDCKVADGFQSRWLDKLINSKGVKIFLNHWEIAEVGIQTKCIYKLLNAKATKFLKGWHGNTKRQKINVG